MVVFSGVYFENCSSVPIKYEHVGLLTFSIQVCSQLILQLNSIDFWQRQFLCKYTVQIQKVGTLCPFALGHITDLMDMSLRKLRKMVKDREAWHAAVQGVAKSRTRLSDGTTISHLKIWVRCRALAVCSVIQVINMNSGEVKDCKVS